MSFVNSTILGGNTIFNGVTTFSSQPLITSTILVNDNSSSIPTTSWTNSYWAYVKTNSNTWTAIQTFSAGIIIDNMSGSNATSEMKIGSNLTSGSITLGTATSSTTILGTTNVSVLNSSTAKFDKIDSNVTTLNIGPTNATIVNIGNSTTIVNIPSGIINASFLNISSTTFGNTTNTVLIDTLKKNTSTTQIHIGLTNAEQIFIGNGTQNKAIFIGATKTTLTNDIRLGTNNSTINISGSYINIGAEGLPSGGGVVVAAGNNNAGSFAQFGSHSLPYGYIRAINLEVNTYGGGNTNIGTTDSGTTTFYRPLSIGYDPAALNNWNQIGYSVSNTVTNGVSTTARCYAPINNLVNGVYLTNLYLYNYPSPNWSNYGINLANSYTTITNGQEYATNVIYDGGQEATGVKPLQNRHWCMKAGGIFTITDNRNLAIRAITFDSYANESTCVLTLKVTRIA